MIINGIIFFVVTIAVCTINLASITLSKPVERLLYEMKEDAEPEGQEVSASSSKKENITNFEEDLGMAPVTESEEKAEPEEKTELESESKGKMKNYAAFSKAMAGSTKRKSKSGKKEEPEEKKSDIGMSVDSIDFNQLYDDDENEEEEEDEWEDLSAEGIGYGVQGEAAKYEEANERLKEILGRGAENEKVKS